MQIFQDARTLTSVCTVCNSVSTFKRHTMYCIHHKNSDIKAPIILTAPDKRRYQVNIFFLFIHKPICCGYSLEVPRWGTSNEYWQHLVLWKKKKYINTFWWEMRLIWSHNTYPKFWTCLFYYLLMCLKCCWISVKQCRLSYILQGLIWFCTIFSGQPVPILRVKLVVKQTCSSFRWVW